MFRKKNFKHYVLGGSHFARCLTCPHIAGPCATKNEAVHLAERHQITKH